MPAIKSHASRSRSLERVVLLLTIVACTAIVRADDFSAGTNTGTLVNAAGAMVVSVQVNDEAMGEAIVVLDAERGLLVERADLTAWRVATSDSVELHDGVEYMALREIPGLRHLLDRQLNALTIDVDPAQFVSQEHELYDLAPLQVAPAGLGAFMNYDAEFRTQDNGYSTSGYFQFGLSANVGVVTSDWALGDEAPQRLNTTFTHDSLSSIATLRVGDFTGANSTLSGGVPIGGVQWATNFATRPGFVQTPLQRFHGEVSVPSTVEIFVNGVPIYRTEVAPGPFTITDVPLVSGGGTVEMVIIDALGRRQVVSNPYYATPTVLRAGIAEFSYELGMLRVPSASGALLEYDMPVLRGVHRVGLSDSFTAEFQAEGSQTSALVGGAFAWLVPGGAGVLRGGLALSNAPGRNTGALGLVGYEGEFDRLTVSLEAQHETQGFARIGGLPPDPLHSRGRFQLALAYNGASVGSLSLAIQREQNLGDADSTVSTVSWSPGRLRFLNLSVSGSYDTVSGDASAFANISVPLGTRTHASLGHTMARPAVGAESAESTATLQRNVDTGPSWGYRISAVQGGNALAELALQGDASSWRVGTSQVGNAVSSFAAVGGSLVLAGGSLHASRRLGDGFALIRVPGAADVGVYVENAYVGRTNDEGERLVPSIMPYRPTQIALDASRLPLDVELRTDRLEITVPYRAAAVLEFPSDLTRAYTATLVRQDGELVPAGARLWFDDAPDPEPIGSDGFVYLSLNPGSHLLTARWADSVCVARVTIEPSDDPQPDLGTLICEAVMP